MNANREGRENLYSTNINFWDELKTAVDYADEVIYIIDKDFRIIYANHSFFDYIKKNGKKESQILEKCLFDILKFFGKEEKEEYKKIFGSGDPILKEKEYVVGDSRRFLRIRKIPLFKEGRANKILTILKDITEQKEMERKLKESEEKHRSLVERANDGIVILQDGVIKFANPKAAKMGGYESPEEIVGKPFLNFVHPSQAKKLEESYKRRLAGNNITPIYETVLKKKDGSELYVEINGGRIIYDGKPADLVIIRDITERKKHLKEIQEKRKALEEEKMLWEETFQSIAEGISIHDRDFTIKRVNRAMCELLGRDEKEIIGKKCYEIFHSDEQPPPYCPMKRALETGKKENEIVFEPTLNRYFIISTSPMWRNKTNSKKDDEKKELIGVIHSIRDITSLKTREKALEKLARKLEVANKMKSEFVSIVSHDFGNPLGVIQGTAELMEMGLYGEIPQKAKEKLKLIQDTTRRLNDLRKDTLELTKMDLGQFKIKKERYDICEVVHEVVEEMKPQAQKKNQTIEVHCEKEVFVLFDKVRIFQVLENYLSNAIRYTQEGGKIEINVEEKGAEIVVAVKDNGRGLPSEELENVFIRFYRVGERINGSTGLGLSIVKGIIEAHGGKCWAESEGLGKGCTFYFSLPK